MAGKIILKVLLVAGILVIAFAIVMIVGSLILLSMHHGDKEEILSADESAKKALIVYQPSLTKASGDVAHAFARGLNDGGYHVLLNHPGDHMASDISEYSIIVLGSPVYAGKTADALAEYIQGAGELSDKKVIVFFTAGSLDEGPESGRMEALLHGVETYASIKFKFDDSAGNQDRAYQLGLDAASEE